MRIVLPATAWSVGPAPHPDAAPDQTVPAQVPGAVQLDWARAHGWPPYWYGNHARDYGWMEDVHWVYSTRTPGAGGFGSDRLIFRSGGVDYRCRVRLGGNVVHEQEGMFTPFEVDCTEAPEGTALEVVVFPAPKRHAEPADRTQASACVKPPVSYGWDWHPRLIPLGIWEETGFERRPAAHLRDAELRFTLDEDLGRAHVTVTCESSAEAVGQRVRWSLSDAVGTCIWSGETALAATQTVASAVVPQPQLWWPHDQGAQPLYRWDVALLGPRGDVLDRWTQRVGFRRVRLVMHPTAWDEPATFPKSRSDPPITIEINGRRIFAKGSNWVNPEIFPGPCTAETYRPLLQLAREANFNLLRCWGGAPVPKEAFFELCDEMGILVWQEFPLACNRYPDDGDYLATLDRESRSILRRGRRHPSLALWCGGNELFNAWSGMTDQALPLRLLNRNCYELDPATPFLPTAPLGGMAHGGYQFRDADGREVFQVYAGARATAYPEFGCPAPSPADYLRTFIPEQELWPPRPGTAWETHHAFGAWYPDTWLGLETLNHYFGESSSLEELVSRGEWLQCAGYQCVYEEARRQKPRCAMALSWCFNEPWPTAANNSLVNWPARPKPALAVVAAACRPVLASARIPKFSWSDGEAFAAELWLLNDAAQPVSAGRMQVTLVEGERRTPLPAWDFPDAPANVNLRGPEVRIELSSERVGNEFTLELTVEERPAMTSRYRLHRRRAAFRGPVLTPSPVTT